MYIPLLFEGITDNKHSPYANLYFNKYICKYLVNYIYDIEIKI